MDRCHDERRHGGSGEPDFSGAQRHLGAFHPAGGSAELGGGVRMLAEDRFYGRDEYEWNITVQDSAGKILTRMRGHQRRVDC